MCQRQKILFGKILAEIPTPPYDWNSADIVSFIIQTDKIMILSFFQDVLKMKVTELIQLNSDYLAAYYPHIPTQKVKKIISFIKLLKQFIDYRKGQ